MEPRLLTEAEADWLANASKPSEALQMLRERGLIAPEPEPERWPGVDEIADEFGINLSAMPRVEKAIEAAIRRAPRVELTLGKLEYLMATSLDDGRFSKADAVRLHAALQEQLKMELAERPAKAPRYPVPEGQTPLDDNLKHRYLDVIREGADAFDSGEGSPYHGYSLEHCLHATGWVKRDLRVALDKANQRIAALQEQLKEAER